MSHAKPQPGPVTAPQPSVASPAARLNFADRILSAMERLQSTACVGLDPVHDKLPAQLRSSSPDPITAIERFAEGVIDAMAEIVPAVKFQSACFERYGAPGSAALARTMKRANDQGLVVILDAKRGDIGISAEHYAAAAVALGAHAITVNAYLGPSTVDPYLAAGLGVFILVRTSNLDSDAVQSLALTDGRTVAEMMADHAATLGTKHLGTHGMSSVGAVVGATKAEDGRALRARMPKQIFLVPGYGAQGGTAKDIRALLTPVGVSPTGGVLVTASRSVIYAFGPNDADWKLSVERASQLLVSELRAIQG